MAEDTKTTNEGVLRLNMLEPRATEKTYAEQTKRVYVFPVDLKTSKQEIAKRVEDEFNVKVTDVKTLIRKGKKTRYSRGKRAYPGTTYRKDKKFAYVRLAKGNSIRVFDEEENNNTSAKDAKKAEKEARKAEKEAEKVAKKAAKADKNAGKENE